METRNNPTQANKQAIVQTSWSKMPTPLKYRITPSTADAEIISSAVHTIVSKTIFNSLLFRRRSMSSLWRALIHLLALIAQMIDWGGRLLKSREPHDLETSKAKNASWECEPKQNGHKLGLRRNGLRRVSDSMAPLHTAASIGKDILRYSFATASYDDISEVTFGRKDQWGH
jgi:hypothetical protein